MTTPRSDDPVADRHGEAQPARRVTMARSILAAHRRTTTSDPGTVEQHRLIGRRQCRRAAPHARRHPQHVDAAAARRHGAASGQPTAWKPIHIWRARRRRDRRALGLRRRHGPGQPGARPTVSSPRAREPQLAAVVFTIAWYGRHGSLRRLGHGGSAVGTVTPGTTGSTRLDGIVAGERDRRRSRSAPSRRRPRSAACRSARRSSPGCATRRGTRGPGSRAGRRP